MRKSPSSSARTASDAAGRRLTPVLLDRLTDHSPHEKREADGAFMLTRSLLRESVLRDLRWLLNTTNLEASVDLAPYARVRESVLNFGAGALAGLRMSEIEWSDIERTIREAILTFEPRIVADSLQVKCVENDDALAHHNLLMLEIRGQIWAVPYPFEFVFRSEVDLENGYMVLQAQRAE
jgi:type VI secretion system protein ImpF